MGKKKTTSEQTNKPVYEQEIKGAHGLLSGAYQRQQPKVDGYADMIGSLTPELVNRFKDGDPAVNAARSYVTETLGSDPQNNPYLDEMVAQTGDNTRRSIQTQLGTRGGIGGSSERDIVGRALSQNELGMRYNDYQAQMDRKQNAAGMANQVVAGDLMTLAPAMATAEFGAMLPLNAANQYAAGTGGLLGQYQNVKGKQTQSGIGWGELIGAGLQGASMFSDRRLKTDIKRVGATDEGLDVFTYRYGGQGPFMMGVMAQDVADVQPDALGAEVGGFMTVDYKEVA